MWTILIVVAAACVCVVLASRFMWWATKRSAIWALAAGLLLGLIAILAAVLIAWVMTRRYWRGLDLVH